MKILVTGGAGFVGSRLAESLKRAPLSADITVLDNLRRRGSEINLRRLTEHGIAFQHGDIRNRSDLGDLPGAFDLLLECSAEPSVHSGMNGSPNYVLDTNLVGTMNCLDWARERGAGVIFLSTSRVYSIGPLREIALEETDTRFTLAEEQVIPGVTAYGIAENFSTQSARSFYGASKLASELLIQEYAYAYGTKAVINRCGVIAGPGQFGKVDQGVFTLWVANHFFGRPLKYTGFGGTGKQVRDLLHPDDLFELVLRQIDELPNLSAEIFNVGGGMAVSTSLAELTQICREVTGREVAVKNDPQSAGVDIPLYLSDCRKVNGRFDWKPRQTVTKIVEEIHYWLRDNRDSLEPIFSSR